MNQNVNSNTDWANFRWNSNNLLFALGKARNMQGRLIGKMETLGFEHREEALLKTLTLDILKSAEIEREILNPEQLKLSIAKRLGIKISNEYISDTEVDNIVEIILDATQQNDKPLNAQTLFKWHTALFPSAERGMNKIVVCDWRSEKTNYKEVVSIEPEGKIIHFTTPDPTKLNNEMNTFFDWFNSDNSLDPLLKAGIAHLWLLTVQPFDKGNGVIAHIISNMILSKADECSQKYYSLSSQFCIKKNEYFNILEKTKKDGLDITEWLIWFLNCLIAAYNAAFIDNKNMMSNLMFWNKHLALPVNNRQKFMINKLLDGFDEKLSSSKWASISKCSSDTALRDIQYLMSQNILLKKSTGGRSTNYELNS